MFQSVKTIFREFFFPYFEVANACMLNIYGTAAAWVWLCRLCLCSFAGVCPVLIVSVPFRGCLCVALFLE